MASVASTAKLCESTARRVSQLRGGVSEGHGQSTMKRRAPVFVEDLCGATSSETW